MNLIFNRLTDLAACLCAEIAEADLPEPCFCGVIPGAQAARDYTSGCDDGMAWVRLAGTYPASSTGVQDRSVGNCGSQLGFDIEVGIIRGFVSMDSDGEPLGEAHLLATTELQTGDMMAMWRAITCCPSYGSKDFIIGSYAPIGPEGDVLGGSFSLSMVL